MSAAAPASPSPRRTPFSDTRFRNLWLSSGLFFSGFWAQTVVLGWLAFELTDSEFAVAAFTSARFAPLLIGPLGGVIADRTDRPRALRISIAIAFGVGVAVAALAMLSEIQYWQVLIAGLLIGIMQGPLQPVRFTLIMDIVGRDLVSTANALNMAGMFGSRIVVPAAAAWLIDQAGADWALWFSAVWYIPAWLLLLSLREIERASPAGRSRIVADFLYGFGVAVRHREIAGVLLASVAANVFAWPIVQGFLPVFAEQVLDVGASGLGVLVAANGLGALAGALAIAALGNFRRKGRLFFTATGAFGLFLTAFALTDWMPLAVVLIFFAGFAGAGFGVMQSTLMLLLAPEEVRGRAMGVLMLSIGALPISLLVLGAIAGAVGVVATTIVAGIMLALAMVLLALAAPGVWRMNDR